MVHQMTSAAATVERQLEHATIPNVALSVSRVALGTWAIGGWMWGGTDEGESIATIQAALDRGINIIDTAPAYGFGRSEEIVGRAIAGVRARPRVIIATKTGIDWRDGKPFRNASRERIMREIDDSLRRLRTDYVDIYQVHWPDPQVPIEETADAMHALLRNGKIRAIGVSNFSVDQIEQFRRVASVHVVQPPYSHHYRSRCRFLLHCRYPRRARSGRRHQPGPSPECPEGRPGIRRRAACRCDSIGRSRC
jgi:aryl-alcohol dehydrogenase-like predicted oxidoreductase